MLNTKIPFFKEKDKKELIISLFFTLLLIFFTGKSIKSYTLPFGILKISINSDKKIEISSNVAIPTIIGTFELSSGDAIEKIKEERKERVLILIVDNIAYTYELKKNYTYNIQKGDGIAILENISSGEKEDIVIKIFTVDPRSISPNEKTILLEDTVSVRKPSANELDSHPSIWNVFDTLPLDMFEPGKRSFSGTVDSKDVLEWPYYWCAKDMDTLSENVNNMTFRFYINDELLPDDSLYRYSKKIDGWACRYWTTILSNWRQNEIVDLEIVQTILSELNDGYNAYSPGEYRYEIIVSVK